MEIDDLQSLYFLLVFEKSFNIFNMFRICLVLILLCCNYMDCSVVLGVLLWVSVHSTNQAQVPFCERQEMVKNGSLFLPLIILC